jgi:flagellar basal-body rod protein FlgG
MERGLYLAASGMLAEQIRQDQIANDLANANTPGYKADRTSQHGFGDLLMKNTVTGETIGSQATAVQVDNVQTDFAPNAVRDTGNPLDFAVVGDGWFSVKTEQGVKYTRNGQFMSNSDGRLTTKAGELVLGRDGGPVTVGADGAVDPRTLALTQLTKPAKQGDTFVTGTPAGDAKGQVRAQAIEASGADPARSMVDMITSMRAFEAGQKVIQTIDDTLGKAANQVGAATG